MNTVAAIEPRHAAGQRLRERVFRGATLAAAILVLTLRKPRNLKDDVPKRPLGLDS